jgi:hypothetical protein
MILESDNDGIVSLIDEQVDAFPKQLEGFLWNPSNHIGFTDFI